MDRVYSFVENLERLTRESMTIGSRADKITSILKTLKADKLDSSERSELEKVAKALLSTLNQAHYRLSGCRIEAGWDIQAPTATPRPEAGYGEYTLESKGYSDHSYILVASDGTATYAAEPYRLWAEDLRELLDLEDQGWTIAIQASETIHVAGSTLKVICIPPKPVIRRRREPVSPKLRFTILKRDGYKCRLCGASAGDGIKLEIDHVLPVAKGGKSEEENLWVLCQPCNAGKSDQLL